MLAARLHDGDTALRLDTVPEARQSARECLVRVIIFWHVPLRQSFYSTGHDLSGIDVHIMSDVAKSHPPSRAPL